MEYLDRMIADGFGRAALVGALSGGIVGGGSTDVILVAQPLLVIAVPQGVVLRPIYFSLSIQPGVETADSDEVDALFGVDSLGLWTGTGTFTNENPSNLNPKYDKGSMCKVGSAVTADLTTTPRNGQAAAAPVVDIELARASEITNFGSEAFMSHRGINLVYEPAFPEWLEGPCTVFANAGGTRATIGCFITARWVESSPSTMREYAGYPATRFN